MTTTSPIRTHSNISQTSEWTDQLRHTTHIYETDNLDIPSEFAIISAFRHRYTLRTNLIRTRLLCGLLRDARHVYSFGKEVPDGEEFNSDRLIDVVEISLLTTDIQGALRLSDLFDQDAVLIKQGDDVYVVCRDNSTKQAEVHFAQLGDAYSLLTKA